MLNRAFRLAPDLLADPKRPVLAAGPGSELTVNRMKALLFGSVEKIVIHCAPARIEETIKTHVRPEFSPAIPVCVEPTMLGVEYMQVHYSAGLLRSAHADVMVLA